MSIWQKKWRIGVGLAELRLAGGYKPLSRQSELNNRPGVLTAAPIPPTGEGGYGVPDEYWKHPKKRVTGTRLPA